MVLLYSIFISLASVKANYTVRVKKISSVLLDTFCNEMIETNSVSTLLMMWVICHALPRQRFPVILVEAPIVTLVQLSQQLYNGGYCIVQSEWSLCTTHVSLDPARVQTHHQYIVRLQIQAERASHCV